MKRSGLWGCGVGRRAWCPGGRLQAELQLVLLGLRPQTGDTLVPQLLCVLDHACFNEKQI